MLTVTKQFSFCYGHHLPDYEGKCCRIHGHNAVVEVEVVGESKEYEGMVIDFGTLSKIMEPILEEIDHQNVNEKLKIARPTVENIVKWMRPQIERALKKTGHTLCRLRISETPTCWAEWRP